MNAPKLLLPNQTFKNIQTTVIIQPQRWQKRVRSIALRKNNFTLLFLLFSSSLLNANNFALPPSSQGSFDPRPPHLHGYDWLLLHIQTAENVITHGHVEIRSDRYGPHIFHPPNHDVCVSTTLLTTIPLVNSSQKGPVPRDEKDRQAIAETPLNTTPSHHDRFGRLFSSLYTVLSPDAFTELKDLGYSRANARLS